MARFEGRTVLVTGAASGIGAAAAERFHAEGARLVLCDLDGEKLAAFAKGLDPAGDRVVWQALDVACRDAVEALTASAVDELLVALQVAGHGVEGVDQDPELVIDGDVDPVVQVTRGDPPRGLRQSLDRQAGKEHEHQSKAHGVSQRLRYRCRHGTLQQSTR